MSTTTEVTSTSHVGAARTLTLLEAVAADSPEPSSVTALSTRLGMSKTVVHRLLQELVSAGFVAYDEGLRKYRLGPRALMVGMAAIRALDVPRVARPFLERLVEATGETATLSARQGWTRLYLDQVASPREIKMTVGIGTAHALYAGSSSKAILAFMDEQEVARYLDNTELRALTNETVTSRADLVAALTRIREVGYATSLGERQEGAASVAAPVFVTGTTPWGSVSVCGPRDRFSAVTTNGFAHS